MNSFEIAKALINSSSSRSGNTASHKASQTTTIFGTATSDSEDGKVRVFMDTLSQKINQKLIICQ